MTQTTTPVEPDAETPADPVADPPETDAEIEAMLDKQEAKLPVLASPAGEMTWTQDQVDLIKRTVAKGASDDELRLFMHVCQRTKLDPFAKQIYFIKRWDTETQAMVFQPQTAIDGLRLIAERTAEYQGKRGPQWCGDDGEWKDVWTAAEPPVAAKVEVLRKDREPSVGIALMREYIQTKKDGTPTRMWGPKGMPVHMIGKCAESLALRAAFPQELGDVYSFEELAAPEGQGEDAAEIEAEAEVVASVEQVDEIKAALKLLKGRQGWAEHEVLGQASKIYSRKIGKLAELRPDEANGIIEAARTALAP